MFYSHEVLTSKKYGVATVWLMATLGPSKERKKLNRHEILRVDVPKACETITSQETPLALRLQSNLLFGVSRVYSQQCTFVLSDAESVRVQVRNAMKMLRAGVTTSTKDHVAKRDQIMLTADPRLDLGANLDFDALPGLPILDLDFDDLLVMQDSNLFTIDRSTPGALSDEEELATQQLDFLSPDFGIASGNSLLRGSSISSSRRAGRNWLLDSQAYSRDDTGQLGLFDAGFTFDENGELIDEPPATRQVAKTPSIIDSDFGRNIPNADQQKTRGAVDDYDLPVQDDIAMYDDAQPFPTRQGQDDHESERNQSEEHHTSAVAQSRPRRTAKVIGLDQTMELTNSFMAEAHRNYVSHRLHDAGVIENKRSYSYAVGNAKTWHSNALLSASGAVHAALPHTLAALFVTSLACMTGAEIVQERTSAPKRQSPDDDGEEDNATARKRPRIDESEIGRAESIAGLGQHDDQLLLDDQTLELGRVGQTPLAEGRSSTARVLSGLLSSLRGTSARGRSPSRLALLGVGGGGIIGSATRNAASSLGAHGSSNAPSPLRSYPRNASVGLIGDDTFALPGNDDLGLFGDDHEQRADADLAHQPLVQESQSVDVGLFLEVLREMVEVKRTLAADADTDSQDGGASAVEQPMLEFEEVIKPEDNSRFVATGAFVSLLMLGCRSLIGVEQEQSRAFMPVEIAVLS